jgi:hypothetical protein
LCEEASARSVWTVPFANSTRGGGAAGALCFESAAGAPSPETLELCEDITALVGPALQLRRRERDSLGGRWSAFLRPLREHVGRRNLLAAAAFLLAVFALAPGDFRIGAQAKLQGRVVRVVAAGVEGYVAETHVRAWRSSSVSTATPSPGTTAADLPCSTRRSRRLAPSSI